MTSDDGSATIIQLSTNWQSNDLAGEVLIITLSYTVDTNTFTYPDITATYLTGNMTETIAVPPSFSEELNLIPTIPCLGSPEA